VTSKVENSPPPPLSWHVPSDRSPRSLSPPLLIHVLHRILFQTLLIDRCSIDQLGEIPNVKIAHHDPNMRVQAPFKLLHLLLLIRNEVHVETQQFQKLRAILNYCHPSLDQIQEFPCLHLLHSQLNSCMKTSREMVVSKPKLATSKTFLSCHQRLASLVSL
jgi:hypothetical protein